MNVPVYGTDNVSQFAVSLLMEVCSHIGHHNESVHKGEWASNADWCYWHYPMIEVSGKDCRYHWSWTYWCQHR